jgi:hypothetical protein
MCTPGCFREPGGPLGRHARPRARVDVGPGGAAVQRRPLLGSSAFSASYAAAPPTRGERLADICELFGLYLLVVDLRVDGASALLDDGPAPVGADGLAEPGRRRWTAAHELVHHLFADEYHTELGVAASRDQRERAIEAFAGEFLLPTADVERTVRPVAGGAQADIRDCLIGLAGTYPVFLGSGHQQGRQCRRAAAGPAPGTADEVPLLGDLHRVLRAEPMEDQRPVRPAAAPISVGE